MKKLLFITLGLAAVFSLTSCVESQQVNPNFDPNTNTVNTQFVLNIAAVDENPQTKQTPYNAQIEGFLGIDNATLFTFQTDHDGEKVLNPTRGQAFDLSTVLGADAISETNSKRVLELPLPLGANSMIFYGMSIKGSRSDEMAGLTEYIYPDDDLSHIGSFAVARLQSGSAEETNFTRTKTYILSVLNSMLHIGLGNTTSGSKLDNTAISTSDYSDKIIHWQDYLQAVAAQGAHSPLDAGHAPGALEIILGNTYKSLTEISETEEHKEARSGAGSAIGGQMRDLLYLCQQAEGATSTGPVEDVAKEFFAVLKQYITTFFTNDKWNSISAITTGFSTWGISDVGQAPSGDLNDFPVSFKLPYGVAVLKVSEDASGYRRYSYADSPDAVGQSNTVTDITYPPQLCYYCNSPIYVSDSDQLDPLDNKTYTGYPSTVTDWSDGSKWDANLWPVKNSKVEYGHITTTTRGVAMAFNVQYGQAVLATHVYYDSTIPKSSSGEFLFEDNNAGIPGHTGQTNQIIKITGSGSTPKGLVLTGILIGGQPSVANWQYLPWSTIATDLGQVTKPKTWKGDWPPTYNMNKMIYDSYIYPRSYPTSETATKIGALLPMEESVYNYTIVHDNYNVDPEGQKSVYVALEIKNETGQDFWGKDNLVRAGATFYLPITLPVPSWPAIKLETDEQNMMPPNYTSTGADRGKTIQDARVFMADTQTTLNVKLTKDALKCAMVTIPDLRSAKMSFGLSIDLSWKNGTIFNIDMQPTATTNP